MKRTIFALAILLLIAGCGTKPTYHHDLSKSVRKRLVHEASLHVGAPYRYGGYAGSGFDCSGLVHRIYRDALGLSLPRTVRNQYKASFEVKKAKPGDLVFFRIRSDHVNHVGMVVGRSRFIHASKAVGVVISSLKEDYYRRCFASFRRLR